MKTRDLVLIAMFSAMYVVLEYFSTVVPLLPMPQGGSIGLSGIAIMMAAYTMGFGKGLIVALLGVGVSALFDPWTIYHWVQIFFDYPLAYGAYAFCVFVPTLNYKNFSLPFGVLFANFIRFMAHNLSGWIFFAEFYPNNMIWEVMVYNATYMVPTAIFGFIIMGILLPRLKPVLSK